MTEVEKIKVLVFENNLLDSYMEFLNKKALELKYYPCSSREEVEAAIGEVEIIFTGRGFPRDLLTRAHRLKWIQSMGAGVDDLLGSRSIPPQVVLTRITNYFGPRMAEYVLGHMLAVTQAIPLGLEQQKRHIWERYWPSALYQKTMGVIGLGSIGQEVARKAGALGIKVLGLARNPKECPFIKKVYSLAEMEEFVRELDFLVLCTPLTPQTRGLINEQVFEWMKPSAWIINIARGPIIVEKDLIKALKYNKLAGAVLDVFDTEPLPEESKLWDLPGVRITPHISGLSLPEDIVEIFADNLKRFQQGRPLDSTVDINRGY